MRKIWNKLAVLACVLLLSACGTSTEVTDAVETAGSTAAEVLESAEENTLDAKQTEIGNAEQKDGNKGEVTAENGQESKEELLKDTSAESSEALPLAQAGKEGTKESEAAETVSTMQVHFIDVGQGDATLVTCDGESMLIDAGDNSKGTTVQLYLNKQGVKELKYLILTHPDADHIGGADVIIMKYDIGNVFVSDYTKDNKTYEELTRALSDKGLKGITPNVGNTYTLGSAEFTILAPNTTYSDPNNSSIGLLLKNGDDAFLFTGDAEEEAEYDILANGLELDCDVYKAGHHGSRTASTKSLLEAASPTYVVVSCANGNSYGHPHAEPMNNFRSMGMKLFRTDEQGSVVATSDGTEITWNCAPSESWVAGEPTGSSDAGKTSQASTEKNEQVSEPEPAPSIEPAPEPTPEPTPVTYAYAVNSKNGKIHMIGACPATGTGKNAMTAPVYFTTYEDAEAYSATIEGNAEKRKCGNCW